MADESEQVGQDEIEQLLRQSQAAAGGGAAQDETQPSFDAKPQRETNAVDQSEIEALLSGGAAAAASAPPQATATQAAAGGTSESASQDDIELLLSKAQQALASIDDPLGDLPTGVRSFRFEHFSGTPANSESATLELMRDVKLDLTIELGRTYMQLEDVLKLKTGAVVALDKLAGDPADIFVNGRLIARGEVLVLNDNFCIRVAELIVGESACA
jgi:flagellar motor switch protein FliN/FliY